MTEKDNTRIYLVTSGLDSFLVKAVTKTSAINFIAKRDIEAKVASQLELVEMIGDGAKVLVAGSEEVEDDSESSSLKAVG